MTRTYIGELADIPTGQCLAVADDRVGVARVGDEVVAFKNECLHQASPLAGGLVKDQVLVCPLHFWRYDLPAMTHVGTGAPLDRYPVEVIDGGVWVDVPPLPAPKSMREQLLDHAKEWEQR